MGSPAFCTFGPHDLAAAAAWLAAGRLIVFPTETFYGLAADPRSAAGVEQLLTAKGDRRGRPLPLLAADVDQVASVVPDWASRGVASLLAETFWPGPLSLVLGPAASVVRGVAAEDGSIAIRVSAHALARDLARALGFPLVSTSANRSGAPPRRTARAAAVPLARACRLGVIDGGEAPGGAPSTLVDPSALPVRILREGALGQALIDEVLASAGADCSVRR